MGAEKRGKKMTLKLKKLQLFMDKDQSHSSSEKLSVRIFFKKQVQIKKENGCPFVISV
jgi:hypothetical protein